MVQYGQSMQGFLVHPTAGFHNLGLNAIDPPSEIMNFYAPPLNQETIMEVRVAFISFLNLEMPTMARPKSLSLSFS